MNEFARELAALTWAMEPKALEAFIGRVSEVTQEQIDRAVRAIREKPELLARLHARDGDRSINAVRRPEDVQELDIRGGVCHIGIAGPMMKQVPSILNWIGAKATSTEAVIAEITAAVESNRVESIQLDIDSPGGTVDGTAALAETVAAVRGLKPIKAVAPDLMASAALWVGAQADSIEVGVAAGIGSIGVFNVLQDTSAAAEKRGIKTHVVSSHELKGAGAPGSKITDAQLADIKRVIDSVAAVFVDAVAAGRGMDRDDAAALATGQMWVGAEAVKLGLADSVRGMRVGAEAVTPDDALEDELRSALDIGPHDPMSGHPLAIIEEIQTAAMPAAQEENETMTPEEKAEFDRLRAENAAQKVEIDKTNAKLEAEQGAQREALLSTYADRIAPSAFENVAKFVRGLDSNDEAEAFLKDLPTVANAVRETTSETVDADDIVSVANGAITVEEKSLGKIMGQSRDRLRDCVAIGSEIDHVEYERVADADGTEMMQPIAVANDGTRYTKAQLRARLGLKGALTSIVFALCMLFGGDALAAAATTENPIKCRLSGFTKSYLMEASNTIYAGSMVMIDDGGEAVPAAAEASNNNVAGIAQETVTSASSGSYWIKVSDGVICLMAGTTLEQEDVGGLVYAEDSLTVDETAGANEGVAGVLLQYVSASSGWVYFSSANNFGRMSVTADPMALTGDLTAGGGAGAVTFTDTASSVIIPDNDATALLVGSTGMLGLMTFDTTNDNEELNIVGTTSTSAFRVDTGFATFDEQAVLTTGADCNGDMLLGGGAGALTFDAASASILTTDNVAAGLDIGSAGATDIISIDTQDAGEGVEINGSFEVLPNTPGAAIGWLVADAANQACSTTCAGTGGCVMGIDSATHVFVLCDSALADSCLCSGPTS